MNDRPVLGLTEEITIIGNNGQERKMLARVDSGATASSIDIAIAEELELGPVTRTKVVKSASGVVKRPIVKVQVRINSSVVEAEFTLADRNHMTYSALIGQNILKEGKFLSDPLKSE